MKIWIIYDSKYGNNKKVVEVLKGLLKNHDVHVSYAKDISPKEVAAAAPDGFLFGGPRRIGNISYTLRKWVEKYTKILVKQNIRLKKVAAWETKGNMKEEDLQKAEGMEQKIFEKNQKTPDLWKNLVNKIPVEKEPIELLSLIVDSQTPEVISSEVLVNGYEEKLTDFIQKFERT